VAAVIIIVIIAIIGVVAAAATTPILLSLPHGLPSIVISRPQSRFLPKATARTVCCKAKLDQLRTVSLLFRQNGPACPKSISGTLSRFE
jgi:hypothetical protein